MTTDICFKILKVMYACSGEMYSTYACFVYTLYDLLRVVGEELAEWGSLGPLQGVEQLLDLRGHSTAHRNS